jgi:hypothetical protein
LHNLPVFAPGFWIVGALFPFALMVMSLLRIHPPRLVLSLHCDLGEVQSKDRISKCGFFGIYRASRAFRNRGS